MAETLEYFGNNLVNADGLKMYHDRLMSKAKYIHELYITAGGAGGSFEIYTRLYRDNATAVTINDLVSAYTMSNKMSNINGYLSNASGTTAVYNVFFESTTTAHFNGASLSCSGSDITVTDTVVGRVL